MPSKKIKRKLARQKLEKELLIAIPASVFVPEPEPEHVFILSVEENERVKNVARNVRKVSIVLFTRKKHYPNKFKIYLFKIKYQTYSNG